MSFKIIKQSDPSCNNSELNQKAEGSKNTSTNNDNVNNEDVQDKCVNDKTTARQELSSEPEQPQSIKEIDATMPKESRATEAVESNKNSAPTKSILSDPKHDEDS